jgi:uncharacterized protein YjbI with pentapeptide repeats
MKINKISLETLSQNLNFIETDTVITFSNFDLDEELDISNTTIDKKLVFENVKLNHGIKGDKAVFENGLKFKDCIIRSMFMNDVQMNGFFQLQNIKFSSPVSFSRGNFKFGFHIDKCNFEHMTYFDQIHVDVERINFDFTIIKDTVFDDLLDLNNSKFNSLLVFDNVTFKGQADFTEIQLTNENFDRSMYSALNFRTIEVANYGILKFVGTEQEKLFNNDVLFNNEVINGKIEFEYANYNKINPDAKNRFAQLLREDKIVIGRGCLKYRHETPKKRINIGSESQNLVTELSNTFVQFFKHKNGINLGVEVRDRYEEYIEIVYFTDENISYAKFESMLQVSEMEMWQLVKINKQNLIAESPEISFPNKILAGSDTIINLMGTILKILTRIPLGKISKEELNSLMTTTSFSSNNQIGTEQVKSIYSNQIVLFGIGNTQITKL